MQMQAKFSAGNDCLRLRQLISRYLPALAYNFPEAFTVHVRVVFFQPGVTSFDPVPKNLLKVNILRF